MKHKQLHCDAQTRKSFSCKYCEKEYVSLGGPKDAHKDTHTAVRLQNVWEGFLQTVVAAGTH